MNKKGFTLMETLLAMTLFLIVIVSSYGVFSMGIQIWKRVTGSSNAQRQMLFTLERMGEDIRSSVPEIKPEEGVILTKKDKDFKFSGDRESFLLPAAGYSGKGYAWNKSSKQLCRMTQDLTQIYQDRPAVCKAVLSGVQKLEFQYWIQSPISKTFSWYDSWQPGEGLPQAVRVIMEVAYKNKKPALKFERTYWVPGGDAPMAAETGSAS